MDYVSAYPKELTQARERTRERVPSPPNVEIACPFCSTIVVGNYYRAAVCLLDHITVEHKEGEKE